MWRMDVPTCDRHFEGARDDLGMRIDKPSMPSNLANHRHE